MSSRQKALLAGIARHEASAQERADLPTLPGGGNFTLLAENARGQKLAEMRAMTVQGILDGTLPLRLPAASIEDPVGTDRLFDEDGSEDTESFRALVENIRRRGLRMPLRVRPRDPEWRPNPKEPHAVDGMTFILQSGRRRLAACRELGIEALVFLSFVSEDAAQLDDLQERFFENTVRRNLTSFEKAWSIGLIASETEGTTQEQIAEIIGVPTSAVSRGLAVLRHRETLEGMIDLPNATVREIDAMLAQIREGTRSTAPEAVRKREARAARAVPLPFSRLSFGGTRLHLRSIRGGRLSLSLVTESLTEQDIQRIADLVQEIETAN